MRTGASYEQSGVPPCLDKKSIVLAIIRIFFNLDTKKVYNSTHFLTWEQKKRQKYTKRLKMVHTETEVATLGYYNSADVT